MGHCIYGVVSVSIGKAGGGGCAASSTGHVVPRTGCSQVPLHYGVQVPLNYGVQELRLRRGHRRSRAKAVIGQVEQRPDHPAEVCGFFA
jgi:hypothetical protein